MPGPRDDSNTPTPTSEEVRSLLREQRELRREVDRLRRQQQEFLEKQPQNGKPSDGDKPESDEGQQDEKKPGKDEKEEKEESKPPLKERARAWSRAHPYGVVLLIAAGIGLAVGGFLFWSYLQSYVSTDDAEVDGHIHQISSRISGTVTGVYVENNRSVTKAQTLVDLDPQDYLTALAQAEANLAQALGALEAQSPHVPITQTAESTNVATANLEIANADAAVQAARQSYASALAELRQAEVL